ncbi:MAG: hypothetical protein KDA58_07345, partial [Planctomycetaceae bacterium]|nr:hypothetical protein [Planctomycetaceae bacterium]
FCCQAILPELTKIERLQENNQPRMALQAIDKLLKDHPDHGWLVTQRAMALFNEQRFGEARDGLVPFLRKHQDHPLANVLLATAVSQLEPYPASKKVIHRAFLKSTQSEPALVALLAGRIAAYHLEEGNFMAARQHMAMVLRLGSDQERQQTLMAMLEVDADASIPYPLRGAHPLPKYTPVEGIVPDFKKAMKLAALGCFEEAADALEAVSSHDADSPQMWHTLGLLRAWDGDGQRACAALHKAAALYADQQAAVHVETLAQLIERELPENAICTRMRGFEVESVSKLLTRLDNEDRLSRAPVDGTDQDSNVSARYDILDRPQPTDADLESLTVESAPRIIGRVGIFDRRNDESPARAVVTGVEGDRLNRATEVFVNAAGDLAKESAEVLTRPGETEPDDLVVRHPRDEITLSDAVFVPPKTPGPIRRKLRLDLLDKTVNQTWMNAPQAALGDKSPAQAKGDASLQVPLAAATYVLDTFLDGRDLILDIKTLRDELGVPQPPEVTVEPGTDLNSLSSTQLQHVDCSKLPDDVFEKAMQRILVTKHCRHGYEVLKELLEHRPELIKKDMQEASQAHATLADICSHALRDQEALEWVEKGFQFTKDHEAPFQAQLFWKMRELSYRAVDPKDPQLKPLLLELWNHYGSKIPPLRERLREVVSLLEIDAPWDSAILTAQTVSSSGGAILTAETEETVAGEKKLWLPD